MACLICGAEDNNLIISKRVAGLQNASTQRGDGLGLKLGNDADSFMTHTNCIKHIVQKNTFKDLWLSANMSTSKLCL